MFNNYLLNGHIDEIPGLFSRRICNKNVKVSNVEINLEVSYTGESVSDKSNIN